MDCGFPLFSLKGKKALVTGGAVGIGRACAHALAAGGADVAIVDIDESMGRKTAMTIGEQGVRSMFVHCDIADQAGVTTMTAAVVEKFGQLDIAVNNAGFGIACAAESLAIEDWRRVLDVNLTGVFLCAQAQAQAMIEQQPCGGKIINMASMYASIAGGNCAYNAAKAGVVQLTRTLAAEWGKYNINVNSISPSWTMTPGMSSTSESVRQRMREVTPVGHIQRPEDICGAVHYLASPASNYVTGHNLVIDGGHTVNTWFNAIDREIPPRISPDEEIVEMMKDLRCQG